MLAADTDDQIEGDKLLLKNKTSKQADKLTDGAVTEHSPGISVLSLLLCKAQSCLE